MMFVAGVLASIASFFLGWWVGYVLHEQALRDLAQWNE